MDDTCSYPFIVGEASRSWIICMCFLFNIPMIFGEICAANALSYHLTPIVQKEKHPEVEVQTFWKKVRKFSQLLKRWEKHRKHDEIGFSTKKWPRFWLWLLKLLLLPQRHAVLAFVPAGLSYWGWKENLPISCFFFCPVPASRLALSREWGNQPLHWYIGDSFPHSLLRASYG